MLHYFMKPPMEEVLATDGLVLLILYYVPGSPSEGLDPDVEARHKEDLFFRDDGSSSCPHRSSRTATRLSLVCREWRDLLGGTCFALWERQEFELRKRAVWSRLERRQAARARLSQQEAERLDHQLWSLLHSHCSFARNALNRASRPATLGKQEGTCANASTEPMAAYELGDFNLSRLLPWSLRVDPSVSVEDFVVLEELVCAAGRDLGWSSHRCYVGNGGEELPFFVLRGMTGTWCLTHSSLAFADCSTEEQKERKLLRVARRSFGLFRTMVLARLYHAQHPAAFLLGQSSSERLAERITDLTFLFPSLDRDRSMMLPHVIAELTRARLSLAPQTQQQEQQLLHRGHKALVWDVLQLLDFGGLLRGDVFLTHSCQPPRKWCAFEMYLHHLMPSSSTSSYLFLLRLFRRRIAFFFEQQREGNDEQAKKEKEKGGETEDNGAWKQVFVEGLLHMLRRTFGIKTEREKLTEALMLLPELRRWIVDQEDVARTVFRELCRMRCREFLGLFLKHERNGLQWILPELVEYMRSKEVRGCKEKLIRLLENAQEITTRKHGTMG
ncbi:hypothetical protein QOT17_002895 [Balamuthia mandrillaris]